MQKIQSQAEWMARAAAVMPAGGNGNFDPGIIIRNGKGSRIWDVDGNEYVDYLISSGPLLLGHHHPEVMDSIFAQLGQGLTFFANNTPGIELAERIVAAMPCAEQLRYVSTGGEADMYAMRLARAATGRAKILKFEGGYHGMSAEAQMSLAPAKPGNFPNPVPDSAGIPDSVTREVLIAPYNDADGLASILDEYGADIAAIIIEPLQRIIPPAPGFLQAVRDLCDRHGILLIFDEIVTFLRFAYGGAQEHYGVIPDIATFGKVVGGGFPLAGIAASRDIMACFDKDRAGPERWLMQSGTLSGNPLAAAAGATTMDILARPGTYDRLRGIGQSLMDMQADALNAAGIAHQVLGDQTLFDVVFTEGKVTNYRDMLACEAGPYQRYNQVLRARGVFKPVGKLYPSLALTDADLDLTRSAVVAAVAAVSGAAA